ncbi:MAG: DNA polymerase III subunit gamma/tau, partial [Spirochaetia bacterium]|nr:DNA polymerase III subunit gamma/tau [Spirochaetia bacterium]
MSYLVTARKWRPQTFESVVGQEHVTRTLQNSLRQNRLAHSYLFSGPRGVGKTTLARILVKALNCEKGPTPTPCNVCSYCVEINEGRSLDYQEIDGASNRGIDQIRELNQSLGYLSPNQRHRVFVIDEVHMLTTEAFNALLKSLEEPPPKVVFVFCTTEAHKVPLTIRSRCQHHHFRAFSIPAITDQLRNILSAEKIAFEEESLFPIARAANGSMRDSQSLLDQVIAYAGEKITSSAVREVLGIIGSDNHFHFMEYLLAGDLAKNQALLLNLAHEGRDLKQFVLDLIHFLTALVFIQKGVASSHDLEVSPE